MTEDDVRASLDKLVRQVSLGLTSPAPILAPVWEDNNEYRREIRRLCLFQTLYLVD